jgi:hypothetical protein
MIVRSATSTDLDSVVARRMRLFAKSGKALGDEYAAKVEQGWAPR